MADAERDRLDEARRGVLWKQWGPYLAERAWGTVREDYGPGDTTWSYFPHDHARSRAYRWSEDGLCGLCDDRQLLCLALALWNGQDPIVKERMYGLAGPEGRHGEDVKEYWWYLDATPTHSWMRWRYHYPQAAFPYQALIDGDRAQRMDQREFELLDTGVFDQGRFWIVTVDVAKAAPDDLCLRVRLHNAGPDTATLHVLPTLWFRNTWSWGPELAGQQWPDGPPPPERPSLSPDGAAIVADHPDLGRRVLAGDGSPEALFCDNESNRVRLGWGGEGPACPKDGIVDHVRSGGTSASVSRTAGTKGALHYTVTVAGGGDAEIRLRFQPEGGGGVELGAGFDQVLAARELEADAFYAALTPAGTGDDAARVMRQAFAGMLWSKQWYHYDVTRWLDGDPGQPPPPQSRTEPGARNVEWRHLRNADVVSMPDTWEYPWYAAWDLAFHAVVLAHVDPDLAKDQLTLLIREGYQHPDGRLPAYEWSFGQLNPPVHAWAAIRVFEIDGSRDFVFLEHVLDRLRGNFDSWLRRVDADGNNLFEGGFLGLDNIGPINRSNLPPHLKLEQSDGTAWMAMYSLNLIEMCFRLSRRYPVYQDLAMLYFEHFLDIANAMDERGMWNDGDGFFYDVARGDGVAPRQVRVRSMVGLVALYAVTFLKQRTFAGMPRFEDRLRWIERYQPDRFDVVSHVTVPGEGDNLLFSIVDEAKLRRILARVFDPAEFLSPHGVRSLSRAHLDPPFQDELGTVRYAPGEALGSDFGGNSNWRGPVWFPVNYLLIEALRRFHQYFGDGFVIEYPTGSGAKMTLGDIATDLSTRLAGLFLRGPDGRRPVNGERDLVQNDPAWRDLITFYEYFHGDTGAGLGASHQTGWTGLVADLINSSGQGGPTRLR